MEPQPPRCHYRACRRRPAIRLHFGNAREDTGDYCEEHAAEIREIAADGRSLLRGVRWEERLEEG
jgi:hypothetical protein